ncbi:MAG: hypothetical protein U0L74_05660, partial [Paludibacteraceae bacterium]|nr:hypothetical protein [Paludibacteraceae bacterium]
PNREVKPGIADGTAHCGRVGSRRLEEGISERKSPPFLFLTVGGFVGAVVTVRNKRIVLGRLVR